LETNRDFQTAFFCVADFENPDVRDVFRRPGIAELLREPAALNFRVGQIIRRCHGRIGSGQKN
jgi:hypothetical protein